MMKRLKREKKNVYDVSIKHSISNQFAVIFIFLLIVTILMCWFMNSTLLEKYYAANKQQVLLDAYNSLNTAVTDGSIGTEEYGIEIQKLCGIYNIDMIIVDADSKTVISSVNDSQMFARQLLDNVFLDESDENILKQTENYTIENSNDPRMNIQYMEMWGILDNGNLFMIRTALEGIKDSVKISNRFLAYVGIAAALLGGLVIWVVSRRITKPIMRLADISQRMTNLDFNAKYVGNETNEIGVLGTHINEMSETLERTISELKTVNNELKKDIEHKEEIDEMRKEFLSNVSHELKTPIALVLGYAEGLKDCINDDPESRDFYCDVIMDEAEKMNTMVKKLLTLNQIEFGNDMVTMERFDLVELVRNYIQSADILIKQNEVEVELSADTDQIFAWGDEFKVEEVFMNYFSNAMNHASYEKKISVTIKQLEGLVRVSVFNTGDKIPEDAISHLWEKFYKVDKARTREYGGSGVGLSIVKAIMESMNQKYGVLNHENGVEFWFELETK